MATVEIRGAATLAATLKRAGVDIGELKEANALASSIAAAYVAGSAPRLTGALAFSVRGSARARGASVLSGTSSVPYAGPINYGWPARNINASNFMIGGVRASEGEWVAAYQADIQKVCDGVRGI